MDSTEARALIQSVESALLADLRDAVGGRGRVPRLRVPADRLKSLELSAEEMFVLSRINGEWDVGTLLQICPLREIDALRALNRFVREGLVDLGAP